MNGVVGFCNFNMDFHENKKWSNILEYMQKSIGHRGIISGNYFCKNSESYNELILDGNIFDKHENKSDTEIILNGLCEEGIDFISKLNGIFAGAFWSKKDETLYIFRDKLGIKPLFYTIKNDTLIFGSEIKALFEFPEVDAILDETGLHEIFALGPARTENLGVFKNIYSIRPGYFGIWNRNGFKEVKYWDLESKEHTDSYEETIEKTSFLLKDAVTRQTKESINVCSMVSGGIDSSVVASIAKKYLDEKGFKKLDTYSFDYTDNDKFFQSNSFQPETDTAYAQKMAEYLGSNQTNLVCDPSDLYKLLQPAVIARDLPGMADIDSSLMYFCNLVKKNNGTALAGECADEVFGGYPWFHREELINCETFPWSRDSEVRGIILNDDMNKKLNLASYSQNRYEETLKMLSRLQGENKDSARLREINYLTIKWFMMTLVDRMDRMAAYSGLGARVPFADVALVEYVWNVPWEMKNKDGIVKNLLREASKGLLPDEILYRKKSPYPKTYNPKYENLLIEGLEEIFRDKSSPILQFIDEKKVRALMQSPSNYGKPWYGQLMAGPQQLAYIIQINMWLKHYKIKVQI